MAEDTELQQEEPIPENAREIEEALAPFGVVKSAAHGRIRLQLRREYRTPEAMASLQRQLKQDGRVQEVTLNERTGSVVVIYKADHPAHGHSLLWRAIKEVELLGAVVFEIEPEEEEEAAEGRSGAGGSTYGKLDQQVADLMYRVDSAIYRRTNGRIHVRGRTLPLAIAGIGVAQILAFGISLEMLPGPLLLWLAHDIHSKFGKEPPMLAAVPEQAATLDETLAATPA